MKKTKVGILRSLKTIEGLIADVTVDDNGLKIQVWYDKEGAKEMQKEIFKCVN